MAIITPEKTIYRGDCRTLMVPAGLGYMGVLAGHAPLISVIKTGRVVVERPAQAKLVLRVTGNGFIRIAGGAVQLVLESAEELPA